MRSDRRAFLRGIAAIGATAAAAAAGSSPAHASNMTTLPQLEWASVLRAARGQQVFFNAWAGDEAVNRYIAWAAGEVQRLYAIKLTHVRVNDPGESVARVLAEQQAGRLTDGSVDLLWINGENFAALRRANLLFGPWADDVPNAQWIDREGNPTVVRDFTIPTDGYELAWGNSRFTFFYDSAVVPRPPADPATLLAWIRAHPGRFTYPQPPQFHGTSFLKQLLLSMHTQRAPFQQPVGDDFDALTRPLWLWLDAAHPQQWRRGRVFPASGPAQRRLLGDGEVDWAMGFNSAEASRAIASGEFPQTIRSLRFAAGALSNSHFVAIPVNARARAAAKVVGNFLVSPAAQARKADERWWGDATVLAVERLPPTARALFAALKPGPATLPASGPVLDEPHPSWMLALEREWARRYRAG
jgi:putative thiamine transport system substrate-binding protein